MEVCNLMVEKDPFGLCYDHYTSALFSVVVLLYYSTLVYNCCSRLR